MQQNKKGFFASRIASFGYAFTGLKQVLMYEHNMRIHMLATIVVIIAGVIRNISAYDWLAITIAVLMVWVAEILNTCIEKLCDLYCKNEYNALVKNIKDMAAAAVMVTSIGSVIVAAIVFLK